MESLFYEERHGFHAGAGLAAEVECGEGGIAVGEEVVDEEHAVGGGEVAAAYTHGAVGAFGEGVDGGGEKVFHRAGPRLLDEHHGKVHKATHEDGWGYAAGFYGDNLVDGASGEVADYLPCKLHHEVGVHLVVDETVHFEYAAGEAPAVADDALVENVHRYVCVA